MNSRIIVSTTAALVATIVLFTCAVTVLFRTTTAGACTVPAPPSDRLGPGVAAYDSEQIANASTIIRTGAALGVPTRGWVIAVAVAIQESSLRNLDHGDPAGPDSRGLFQQRAAWGTLRERMDPATSARLFYTGGRAGQPGLLDIPGWQQLPLTRAANAVQHSAYPDAYADHEDDGTALVTGYSRAIPQDLEQFVSNPDCLNNDGDGLPASASEVLPPGFSIPTETPPSVRSAITWALRQLGTPYSYGGDCTAPHSGDPAHQCDCSSLTQMAYRAGGIALPRTTSNQVRVGTAVSSVAELRPGDLVFIPGSRGTPTTPRHVGLYLGEGLIIQAPKSRDQVKLSRLMSWAPISTMRRVVP